MKKETVIAKLEEGTAALRAVIEQHDGSTIKAITDTIKQGVESMRGAFAQNETAQKAFGEMRKHYDELSGAVEKGDKELTDKLLTAIENKIAEYKGQNEGTENEKP